MAVKLVQGTCPLELANALAQSLAASPSSMAGVFDKVEVGVPDIGVGRWLSRRIAMANGICGDIGFPFTSALVFKSFFGSEDTPDLWSRDALCWTILAVLPDVVATGDTAIGPLRDYLVSVLGIDESTLENHLRTQPVERVHWALAREITELFDDYITFRPDWCRRWNLGEEQIYQTEWSRDVSQLLTRNLAWQRPLWDACQTQIGPSYKLTSLSVAQEDSDTRAIRLFMPSKLSPLMLHALTELGRTRSVEIYLLSHGRLKWGPHS